MRDRVVTLKIWPGECLGFIPRSLVYLFAFRSLFSRWISLSDIIYITRHMRRKPLSVIPVWWVPLRPVLIADYISSIWCHILLSFFLPMFLHVCFTCFLYTCIRLVCTCARYWCRTAMKMTQQIQTQQDWETSADNISPLSWAVLFTWFLCLVHYCIV